ncbi:hypothetical protein ETAE_2843 [Edwardsiella piscicida]|uniref:Uncharacterized protein n=1 Tax=Edwardsiella piscicida TaxID=1263550 RepID=A0AAU8P6Q5_EDWPI|nr:hypothetical protein ETAE_2843 [Edwardsiella tarda EIB202]
MLHDNEQIYLMTLFLFWMPSGLFSVFIFSTILYSDQFSFNLYSVFL